MNEKEKIIEGYSGYSGLSGISPNGDEFISVSGYSGYSGLNISCSGVPFVLNPVEKIPETVFSAESQMPMSAIQLQGGKKRTVHVNQPVMKMNAETGGNDPCVTVVEDDQKSWYGRNVRIDGPSTLIQLAGEKGKMGRVYLETESPILVEV